MCLCTDNIQEMLDMLVSDKYSLKNCTYVIFEAGN